MELGAPLGVVSYHVRMLRDYDCVELVRTEPRRGALQHFYKATARPNLDEGQWRTLPSGLRKELAGETLQELVSDLAAAADAGTLEDPEVVLSRTPLELDERGFKKLNKLMAKTLDQALAIAAESSSAATRALRSSRPSSAFCTSSGRNSPSRAVVGAARAHHRRTSSSCSLRADAIGHAQPFDARQFAVAHDRDGALVHGQPFAHRAGAHGVHEPRERPHWVACTSTANGTSPRPARTVSCSRSSPASSAQIVDGAEPVPAEDRLRRSPPPRPAEKPANGSSGSQSVPGSTSASWYPGVQPPATNTPAAPSKSARDGGRSLETTSGRTSPAPASVSAPLQRSTSVSASLVEDDGHDRPVAHRRNKGRVRGPHRVVATPATDQEHVRHGGQDGGVRRTGL